MSQPKRGISWQASFTIGIVIVVALYIVGTVRGATVTVTPRFMAQGLRAAGYPVRRPKTLTCRTTGSVGLAEFKCVAHTSKHQRRFVAREYGGNSGWMCAGRNLGGCKLLSHGFYPVGLATTGWQANVVAAWIGLTTGTDPGQIPCTGTTSPVICDNVTLTYHRAGVGYVMSAKQG